MLRGHLNWKSNEKKQSLMEKEGGVSCQILQLSNAVRNMHNERNI